MSAHTLIIVLLTGVPLIAMGGYVAVRVRAGKLPWVWFAGIALAVLSVLFHTQTNAVLQQLEALLSTRETALGRQTVEALINSIVVAHIALFASVAGGLVGLVFYRPKRRFQQIQRALAACLAGSGAGLAAFWAWRQQQVVKNKWLSDAICNHISAGMRSVSEEDDDSYASNPVVPGDYDPIHGGYDLALWHANYDPDEVM